MAKEQGSTALTVGLIFSILIAMAFAYLFYVKSTDLEKQTQKTAKEKRKAEAAEKVKREYIEERDAAWKLITSDGKPANTEQYVNRLKESRTTLEAILSKEWVTQEDIDEIKDTRIKETWTNLKEMKAGGVEAKTLVELADSLRMQLQAVIHIIPRLRVGRVTALETIKVIREEKEAMVQEKKRDIDQLKRDLDEERDRADEQARKHDQTERKLTEDVARIGKEKAKDEKKSNLKVAQLQSQIRSLEQRIATIVKKEKKTFEVSGADGEIVYSDSDLGYVWIDLGKNHNLLPGMNFQVFRYVKGGRKQIKGKITVKAVDNDMAKATIVEEVEIRDPVTGEMLTLPNPDDPIVKGDLIRNPLYDRDEQQVFVFLGSKVTNSAYKKEELKRKIGEAGSKVEPAVTINTNFVVLLENAEAEFSDELEKAAQFGVIFMREAELLDYLSR